MTARMDVFSLMRKTENRAYLMRSSIAYRPKGLFEALLILLVQVACIFPVTCIDRAELSREFFSLDSSCIALDESYH